MIINNDKLEIKKPKSMILNEIEELEQQKKETKSITVKMRLTARIQKLSFQLHDQ